MRAGLIVAASLTLQAPVMAEDGLHLADHPLVERIVRTADGSTVERGVLEASLRDADFVIIGEKHDNARHHAIQAELVEHLGTAGDLETVAFEMLPRDRQLALTLHVQDGGNAATLARAIGWEELGWGPWAWYGPIADAALRHDAELVAANLSRDDVRAIYRGGLVAMEAAFRGRTGLDIALEPADQAAREAAMVEAHCGHDLGPGAARMVDVQRARDAMLADRLEALTDDGQGVLITGNGHAETDIAVPPVLARLRPEAQVVSIGLIEVHPDWAAPPTVPMAFDYVWFTPRAKPVDHDYCAAFGSSRR